VPLPGQRIGRLGQRRDREGEQARHGEDGARHRHPVGPGPAFFAVWQRSNAAEKIV